MTKNIDEKQKTQDSGQTDETVNAEQVVDQVEQQIEADQDQEVTAENDLRAFSKQKLIDRVISLETRIGEIKDGYIRAKADVANIQRRSQNEIVSARKYAIEGFAQELLGVLDSLEQASKVQLDESNSEVVEKMKEGLELTTKQMEKVLEKFGVRTIEADQGVRFDPEMHQAVTMIDSDEVEAGHILDVMQKGFMLKDRLLRPAMVTIVKG